MNRKPIDYAKNFVSILQKFITSIGSSIKTGLKRWIGLGLIVIFLAMVVTSIFTIKPFSFSNPGKDSKTNETSVMPEIKVYPVEKKQITDEVNTYGTVSYYQKVNVISKIEEIA